MVNKHLDMELIDCFKVLYSDLHTHEKVEKIDGELKSHIEDIKELMSICDDISLRVKFVCTMQDGTEKHTKYQEIQRFAKEGLDLVENIETIQVHVKAVVRKGEMVMESSDNYPFYKSEKFLLEENIKSTVSKLMKASNLHGEGKVQLISRQNLQDWCNNRIRFPENQTLEV